MEKLRRFLEQIEKGADSQYHQSDIFKSVNKGNTIHFIKMFKIVTKLDFKDKKVLDVGFGVGDALNIFKTNGANAIGICVNQEEIESAKKQNYEVYKMDQNFMTFEDNTFDIVWSRHCLEHSIMPFYTLYEYKRVMKPGSFLYVEVPSQELPNNHADNIEHFSLFSIDIWLMLMKRHFDVISFVSNNMVGHGGSKHIFYSFILKKN
jgi:ubiquinone/menaquinone biosynthesis C-methylase UbiE